MSADSVLNKVMQLAPLYETLIDEYRTDIYLKGRIYIRKRNFLMRFAPSFFKAKRGVREYLTESYGELHYTAPNIYDQKLKATYGTIDKFEGIGVDVLDFFHVNIYSTSLLTSKLVSPLSSNAHNYYTFSIDSLEYVDNSLVYRISFTPKNKSYQLVKGHLLVSEGVWSVREMQFSGRSEYLYFDNKIRMGGVGQQDEFLPVHYALNATFRLLGNVVDGNFMAAFDYKSIKLKKKEPKVKKKKTDYDLTESFTLQCDTSTYLKTDSAAFSALRPIPLTVSEERFYYDYFSERDSASTPKPRLKSTTQLFWAEVGDVGEALVRRHTFDLGEGQRVRFSPILNPFLLSYSGKDGFSYRYDIRYNRLFKGDKYLQLAPRIGYNFKHKEFYWRIHGDYDYWPAKRASLHVRVGNGNRIYSSDVLDDIKEMPDSILNFDNMQLDYFRNMSAEVIHRLEVFNGFTVNVGLSMHRRSAVKKNDPPADIAEETPELLEKIRSHYTSIGPRIGLSWTPGQYYYLNGKRKINLYSKWPTFSTDWERAIKGIMGSTTKYERLEVDVQQKIPLGLMRSLYYRAGCGTFTDQEQLYFVDFVNFAKNNLPTGWNDEIGGVFQLLDRRWYNSSRKYMRGHITYEAPFLIMPRLRKYTRNILNERLYLGVLTMPHLNPYIEVGYGIGTHVFDFGAFASCINGKFSDVGVKFTFELFNR
ncbi:hypothetical protein D0T60_08650 [Bacteroides sp. 224]|nr:hypothetical protein [Bacteroides sp. 224]